MVHTGRLRLLIYHTPFRHQPLPIRAFRANRECLPHLDTVPAIRLYFRQFHWYHIVGD